MGGNSSQPPKQLTRTQSVPASGFAQYAVPVGMGVGMPVPVSRSVIAIPSKIYKKAIVVIGKMSSGKSAFVRMLAHPDEK
jgi:hypothetical protein